MNGCHMTSTMQGRNWKRRGRKSNYSGPYRAHLPLSAGWKKLQIWRSVISEITADKNVVAADADVFWWVLFEKTKSNEADTGSLDWRNWWSPNWMCHTLFTWIVVFNIILFSGIRGARYSLPIYSAEPNLHICESMPHVIIHHYTKPLEHETIWEKCGSSCSISASFEDC